MQIEWAIHMYFRWIVFDSFQADTTKHTGRTLSVKYCELQGQQVYLCISLLILSSFSEPAFIILLIYSCLFPEWKL